jgi:hypothetical protein
VGHPYEYIIFPRAHKTLVRSSVDAIFFMAFLAHVLHTWHKHKRAMALAQTLLHEKTISIRQCAPLQEWEKQIEFTLRICLFYCGKCT